MSEVEAPIAPVTVPVEPSLAPVEPPHVLPGTAPEATPDDDAPLDDVVDDEGLHQPRSRGSRAKSKMAAARINKLTEERNQFRERLEALEKAQKPASQPAPRYSTVPAVPTQAFAKPEPQLSEFYSDEPDADPYGDWVLARAEWRMEKREHEQTLSHQQAHVQQLTQQQQAQVSQAFQSHNQRLQQAIAAKPELVQAFARVSAQLSTPEQLQSLALMNHTLAFDSQGVDMAVFLATHPDTFDELALLTYQRPVNEATVANTRRWLLQRMSAGTTGSVAPSPVLPNAPRPPNPVRTGAIRAGNEPPETDESIADHAKFYMPKR